jgi:phosphoribosylformylglycinamidine synthase
MLSREAAFCRESLLSQLRYFGGDANPANRLHGLPRRARPAIGGFPISGRKARAMKVRVYVHLKNGVLDPQGRAIHHALEGLGFAGVSEVRAGRLFELEVDDSVTDDALDQMAKQLLANMVIENYRIERV